MQETLVKEEEMTRFFEVFVSKEAPYYFEASNEAITQQLLQAGLLVYTQGEFFANFPEFVKVYGYQYHVWMMENDLHVLVADAKRFAMLDASLQRTLLQKQVQFGRGHVYRAGWLRALAEELPQEQLREEVLATLEQHGRAFDVLANECTDDPRIVILTEEIWHPLSLDVQKAWLSKWLTQEVEQQGEAVQLSPTTWQVRPEIAELVLQYVGRFPKGLSANCFAAALGMAMGKKDATEAAIQRWLHSGPFLRSLCAIGYEKVGEHDAQQEHVPLCGEDVLVWVNAEGQGIHAAYVLAPDVIFQKNGQAWPQSWRVVRLEGMKDYAGVLTQGGHIEVYRRT